MARRTSEHEARILDFEEARRLLAGNPSARLLNSIGGFLARHYDYSTNQLSAAMPYMFGTLSYGMNGAMYWMDGSESSSTLRPSA